MFIQAVSRLFTSPRPSARERSAKEREDFDAEAELHATHGDDREDVDDNAIIHTVDHESDEEEPPVTTLARVATNTNASRPEPSLWVRFKRYLAPRTTEEELRSYIPNYRSTPILSGVVIPFAILLEIPGLTEHWYIRTEANKTVEVLPNPILLNVGLGISMACAIVANVFLIARFMEKKVKLMTILCTVFLTIHDIINIVAVVVFAVQRRFSDGYTYGQSFWMTVCSTIASTFTNVTLIYDLAHTPNFSKSGSGLTRKQRALVVIVMILFSYMALGALGNSLIQDLSFIDGLYLTVCSIETIGFGDILPKTWGAKVFICLYAVFGILNVAVVIAMFRETILEGLEVSYRKRLRKLRRHRRETLRKRRIENRWEGAIEWRLHAQDLPVWLRNDGRDGTRTLINKLKLFVGWPCELEEYGQRYGMHLNLEALEMSQLEAAAMEAGVPLDILLPKGFRYKPEHDHNTVGNNESLPLTYARVGKMVAMLGRFAVAVNGASFARTGVAFGTTTTWNYEEEEHGFMQTSRVGMSVLNDYETFRNGVDKEERKAAWARLTVAWVLFITFWTIGGAIFMATEGWSYPTAMYFCFIAFTTIGYGDYSPATPAGRSVFVAWALLGVGTMTILISCLSDGLSKAYSTQTMHMHVFDSLVRKYRERPARPDPDHSPPVLEKISAASENLQEAAQDKLERLPLGILSQTQTLQEHVRYFVRPQATGQTRTVPDGLRSLLDEIIGPQNVGQHIRDEILQDEEARKTLFALSIEGAMKQMVDLAEAAQRVLAERDVVAARAEDQYQ